MNNRTWWQRLKPCVAAMAVASLSLVGCGGDGGGSTTVTTTRTVTQGGGNPPNPPVPGQINVPAFGGNQVATLIMRAVPPTETVPNGLTVTANSLNRVVEAALIARDDDGPQLRKGLPRDLMQAQLETHRNYAQTRNRAVETAVRPRFQQMAEGQQTSFFIVTTNQNINAQKMHAEADTVHCTIMAQVVAGQPVVTKATALAIAQAWDTNNPFQPGSGIYDRSRALLGSEWLTNPVGGRDGDTKVVLLLLNSSAIGGSGFYGYFAPNDELPKTQATSSNEGEILYLNSDFATGDMYDLLATLAHEIPHLILWNTKFGHNGLLNGTMENESIDEGISSLNEQLNGFGLESAGGGNRFLSQVTIAYLRDTSRTPFFVFNTTNADYGQGFLLMRYISERFGLNALTAICTSPTGGMANLSASLGVSFQRVFDDWTMANLAGALTGPVPAQFKYASGFTTSSTFNIRGQGNVTLPGVVPQYRFTPPAGGSISRALPAWTALYAEYSGGSGNALQINLSMEAGTDSNLILQNPRGTFVSSQ